MVGGQRSAIPGVMGCTGTLASMANVRLFASAREAAGRGRDELPGATVADVLEAARDRYGPGFADVLTTCRIWVNGEAVPEHTAVGADDEVAVLPPVSGGATEPGVDEPRISIEETT
jgi:sulfur-carrier protein